MAIEDISSHNNYQDIEETRVCTESDSATSSLDDVTGWIDILGNGSLKKKVIIVGEIDCRPSKGYTVKISARGTLEDNTEVENYEDLIFTLGDGEVISGFDMIIPLMNKGEECEVYMESRFAYGLKGLEANKIPPNSNMNYIVKLSDHYIEEDPENLCVAKRKEIGNRKKERGNWWFNQEDFHQAILCYKSAIDFLDDTSDTYGEVINEDLKELLEDRMKTLNNLAASQIRIEAYDIALKTLDSLLQCQPDNVKALFRKGRILGIQGKAIAGVKCLKRALDLDPQDRKMIQQELTKLSCKAQKEKENERSLYRRMLGIKPSKVSAEESPRKLSGRLYRTIGILFISISISLFVYKNREAIVGAFT